MAGSVLSAAAAAVSVVGVVATRLVGNRNAETDTALELAQGVQREQMFGAHRGVRLASLKEAVSLAQAHLDAVEDAQGAVLSRRSAPSEATQHRDKPLDAHESSTPIARALSGIQDQTRRSAGADPAADPATVRPADPQFNKEYFDWLRRQVNTTGWKDDDTRPDFPLQRPDFTVPKIPIPTPLVHPPSPGHDHPTDPKPRHQPPSTPTPPPPGPTPPTNPVAKPLPQPPPPVPHTPLFPHRPSHPRPHLPPLPHPPPHPSRPPHRQLPQPPHLRYPPTAAVQHWLDSLDQRGNRHLEAIHQYALPDGDGIRVLGDLILPADGARPVVVLSELVGTADPLALRDHVAAVADTVFARLNEQVPGLDPATLHWLVHTGAFSVPDAPMAETFHRLRLLVAGTHHRFDGVHLLDPQQVRDLINRLHPRPVEQVVQQIEDLGRDDPKPAQAAPAEIPRQPSNPEHPAPAPAVPPTPLGAPEASQPDITAHKTDPSWPAHSDPIGRRDGDPPPPADVLLLPV
ncbi:MAG: hypothetical protein H0V41_00560 [Pseudonocardiales bacterium]|nr:hypothetical protein [Pseudonocardiales bacterium]